MKNPIKSYISTLKNFSSNRQRPSNDGVTVFKTRNDIPFNVPVQTTPYWPGYMDEGDLDQRAGIRPTKETLAARKQALKEDHQRVPIEGICDGMANTWLLKVANDGVHPRDARPDDNQSQIAHLAYYLHVDRSKQKGAPDWAEGDGQVKYELDHMAEVAGIYGLKANLKNAHQGKMPDVLNKISNKTGLYKLVLNGTYVSGPGTGEKWAHATALSNEKNNVHFFDPDIGLKEFRSMKTLKTHIQQEFNTGEMKLDKMSAVKIERNLSRQERDAEAAKPIKEKQSVFKKMFGKRSFGRNESDVVSYADLPDFGTDRAEPTRIKTSPSAQKLYEREQIRSAFGEAPNAEEPTRKVGFQKARFAPLSLRDSGFKKDRSHNADGIKRLNDKAHNQAEEPQSKKQLDIRTRTGSRGR
ncbi:MAG: hypothetical protein AAGA53_13075 [Pseudomonadota bacterium]